MKSIIFTVLLSKSPQGDLEREGIYRACIPSDGSLGNHLEDSNTEGKSECAKMSLEAVVVTTPEEKDACCYV